MKRDETDAIWIARTLLNLQIFLYSFPLLHFSTGVELSTSVSIVYFSHVRKVQV